MDQARRPSATADANAALDGTLRPLLGRWHPGLANGGANGTAQAA
jgi:hypothetical protein